MPTFRSSPATATADATLADAFSGPQADRRVAAVRRALARALDDWWRAGTLPSTTVLRDGLLVLEAGQPLDDAATSLLLRSALAYHKGMITALRYQGDPERTASIVCDALLATQAPLSGAELQTLRAQDVQSDAWAPALRGALQEEAGSPDTLRREQARLLLSQLDGDGWTALAETDAAWLTAQEDNAAPWLRTTWVRTLLVLLPIAALVAGVLWWQQRARVAGLISVPAGVYPVAAQAAGGSEQTVNLPAFAIERTEVTNNAYRQCVARGTCDGPASNASATRAQYFIDPTFGQYPVVNVDAENAKRYCAFIGRRLPTAAEWEVAAGFAPGTQRRYRYPWGDQFQVQRANSAATGNGDTQTVGTYQPTGDSPLGVSDMAGNVAEWTATGGDGANAGRWLVKGGSFGDDAKALAVDARQFVPGDTTAAWLGFRCAADMAGEN